MSETKTARPNHQKALRASLLALAGAAAIASSTPLKAQDAALEPIKVGMFDSYVPSLPNGVSAEGVTVNYKEFNLPGTQAGRAPVGDGIDHGQMVAACVVQGARQLDKKRPIELYAANAYLFTQGPTKENPAGRLGIDVKAATAAADWFKASGVHVVVATFVTTDGPATRAVMEAFTRDGIVLVAPAANDVTPDRQFPAKYPDALSVAAYESTMPLASDPSLHSWVQFATTGRSPVPVSDLYAMEDVGSSFASARAAGMLSVIDAYRPVGGVEGARAALNAISIDKSLSIHGSSYSYRTMEPVQAAMLWKKSVRTGADQASAQPAPPAKTASATAPAPAPAQDHATQMAYMSMRSASQGR